MGFAEVHGMRRLNYLITLVIFNSFVVEAVPAFEERNFTCLNTDQSYDDEYDSFSTRTQVLDSLSLCDDQTDCNDAQDEGSDMCDGLLQRFRLTVPESGETWAQLNWTILSVSYSRSYTLGYSLRHAPSGFLLTRRQGGVGLSKKLEDAEQRSYFVEDLLPSTSYVFILRPYKYVNRHYDEDYQVGKAEAVTVRTHKTDTSTSVPAHTAARGFEEISIHCQDPIDPQTNITVTSKSLCDEVQDCFQGADEMKELCGNIQQVQLSVEQRADKFAILKWSVAGHGSPWGNTTEGHRATIYGRRMLPYGLFVTTVSNMDVVTPHIQSRGSRRYMITNLKPSTNYTFMVRPYVNSTESRRGYRVGKAVLVTVVTETAEMQNLTSFPVNENRTVLLWNAEPDAHFFRVTYGNTPRQISTTIRSFPNTIAVDEKNKVFSIIVPAENAPSLFSGVACGNHGCSDKVMMNIRKAGQGDPDIKITSVAATSPTSFYVTWTMQNNYLTVTDGYWVRYCAESATTCRLHQLQDKSLTVTGLRPGTTYNIKVQPRIKTRAGNIELGSMGEAQVSTWTAVPARPTLYSYDVITPPCQLHVDWGFYNSTVSYIQVLLDNDTWFNCTTPHHCNAHVFDSVVESSTTKGSLILWNLEYHTSYELLVRGCDLNGCGPNSTIVFSTPIHASSAPINLSVEQRPTGTVLVRWERPLHPHGPLDGYDVSWTCAEEATIADAVTDVQFLISEPLNGQNCKASVAAYHITEEGHLLRGVEAHIDIPLSDTSE